MQYMQKKQKKTQQCKAGRFADTTDIIEFGPWKGPVWDGVKVQQCVQSHPEQCFLIIDDFLIDATAYLKEHVRFPFTFSYEAC